MSDSHHHIWPFPKEPANPLWWRLCSPFTVRVVGSLSKLWLKFCASTYVYNRHRLIHEVDCREEGRSLITVSNHDSCCDDPLLFGLLNWNHILSTTKMRWSLGAHNICFTKQSHATFFGLGQVIPVVRGAGVFQRGMDLALEKLNQGKWIHIFPESKVNMDKSYIRFKWGVGRLVHDCKHVPVILPIYHLGMDDVLPNEEPYVPRVGKKLTITVGNPLDLKDFLEQLHAEGRDEIYIRQAVTSKIQEEMEILKKEAHEYHHN